jgi:hypothetical protein
MPGAAFEGSFVLAVLKGCLLLSEKMKRNDGTLEVFKTDAPTRLQLCNKFPEVDRTRRFAYLQ